MRLGQHLLFGSTHIYLGLILAHNNKQRTWMGIDRDSWYTLPSTLIINEPKQALNHDWHACIRVVLIAIWIKTFKAHPKYA